jgi:PBSX family phage terminase large subunit
MPKISSAVETSRGRINVYPANARIKLHYYQSRILNATQRFIAAIAGTGGGKTFLGPIWLLKEIEKDDQATYMVVAPNYKMLTGRCMEAIFEYFDKSQVPFEYRDNAKEILFPTGGKVLLRSADAPDSLEGNHCKAIWLDEAGQMAWKVWLNVQARVGAANGRILITTTPYAQNWLYRDFYKHWKSGLKDYFVVQFPTWANESYPKDEIERMKATLDSDTFDMRYRGLFRKREGIIYKDFIEERDCVPEFTVPSDWLRLGGIDWGYNDPFVFLDIAVDTRNEMIYIVNEYYKRGQTSEIHAYNISQMIDPDVNYITYYDPSGAQNVQDLRRELHRIGVKNVYLNPGENELMGGVEYLMSLFRKGKIKVIAKNCPNFIEEISMYSWEGGKDGGNYRDKPRDEDNHTMDGMRYPIFTHLHKWFGVPKIADPIVTLGNTEFESDLEEVFDVEWDFD